MSDLLAEEPELDDWTQSTLPQPLERLSIVEEKRLVASANAGDEAALRRLLREHEELMRDLVAPYRHRPLSLDDLLQVATEASLESFRRYKPEPSARLGTFAYRRIKGALADAVRNEGRVPAIG